MILHTVNKSPFRHSALEDCIAIIGDGDGLLLLEDGVYALAAGTRGAAMLQQLRQRRVDIYAVADDLARRDITIAKALADVISYKEFVALTLTYHSVHSWY